MNQKSQLVVGGGNLVKSSSYNLCSKLFKISIYCFCFISFAFYDVKAKVSNEEIRAEVMTGETSVETEGLLETDDIDKDIDSFIKELGRRYPEHADELYYSKDDKDIAPAIVRSFLAERIFEEYRDKAINDFKSLGFQIKDTDTNKIVDFDKEIAKLQKKKEKKAFYLYSDEYEKLDELKSEFEIKDSCEKNKEDKNATTCLKELSVIIFKDGKVISYDFVMEGNYKTKGNHNYIDLSIVKSKHVESIESYNNFWSGKRSIDGAISSTSFDYVMERNVQDGKDEE